MFHFGLKSLLEMDLHRFVWQTFVCIIFVALRLALQRPNLFNQGMQCYRTGIIAASRSLSIARIMFVLESECKRNGRASSVGNEEHGRLI